MKTRAITGFFFIIVMIGSNLLGPVVYGVFYLLLALLCLHEFYGLNIKSDIQPNRFAGFLNAIIIYGAFGLVFYYNSAFMHRFLLFIPLGVAAIFIPELYKISTSPFTNIAYTITGLVFVVVPFTFFAGLAYVGKTGFNFHIPLAFLIMLWSNDTGAYLVGRFLGKAKLFERHSPKKTMEGFIGGVAIAAGVAVILSHFYPELTTLRWVIIAIIIGCFGTMGDLIESMFKRSINIKDSGGLLPGHGGLLDRFDGFLMAAPIVYTYLYFLVNA